jgi:hypothetical protein
MVGPFGDNAAPRSTLQNYKWLALSTREKWGAARRYAAWLLANHWHALGVGVEGRVVRQVIMAEGPQQQPGASLARPYRPTPTRGVHHLRPRTPSQRHKGRRHRQAELVRRHHPACNHGRLISIGQPPEAQETAASRSEATLRADLILIRDGRPSAVLSGLSAAPADPSMAQGWGESRPCSSASGLSLR